MLIGTGDARETETNVTVSHEEDEAIMAESGLNLAELDMQDDRELIHMVLEDANFEQELEGGPSSGNVGQVSPNFRDSGFYSDGRSMDETSPSPVEDNALEAWLADPEHAVIFLDSALLASLDIDLVTPPQTPCASNALEELRASSSSSTYLFDSALPKASAKKPRSSYTQWKRMRIQSRKVQKAAIS